MALSTSVVRRNRLPPPPAMPAPHPDRCDSCESLKDQVHVLENELNEKDKEIDALKEIIQLNDLQIPAVSIRDSYSGVFF